MRAMTTADVRARADAARKFNEVAHLADDEDGGYSQVVASLAVLAGIAAADAICGHVLGECSRGQDHRQAVAMVRQVKGADDVAAALGRLLDVKDGAHYGTTALTAKVVTVALRSSATTLERMEQILRQ
ncbi:hypothetical protein [Cellulomonas fimi]|uniref:DNA-binding protein n=1 Tax=Cellulomonas fimi TaxID=1708 RepID=A0A7Y0LYJ1_CELFI|nr:hypothetical protein [Cellulomonas fimi]NMR20224.1 hypothetical protein [Cellulomonas fimi]